MANSNPYNLMFGIEPPQTISRAAQLAEVVDSFKEEQNSGRMCMVMGIRGCGKTVFMSEVAKELGNEKDWIIVDLNSSSDLLADLAACLGSENGLASIFKEAGINLSMFGIGLEVKGSVPISNIQVALSRMLDSIKKKGKRVLVCIDEVVASEHMKEFAGAYQIFIRNELPIFLIMTGLYGNINDLRNEKNLTFLYRAPKIELKPLNITNIASNYMKNFSLDNETASVMARITRGYPFAFQVLGHFTWKYDGDYERAIPDVRTYLDEYVYEKVWSELSLNDKKFIYFVAQSEEGKAKNIKELSGFSDSEYSVYRDRAIKRGILSGDSHGYVRFLLPMFEEYVINNYML